MLRLLLLFLHVSGAMTIVAAFGIEGVALALLRRADSPADARGSLASYRFVQPVAGVGMITTLLSGLYLAGAYWGWRGPWFGVALLMIVAMAIIGGVMTGRRVAPLARALSNPADAPRAFAELDPVRTRLVASFALRAFLLLGIVFLMTVKPGAGLSVGAALVAAVLGLVFPRLRRDVREVDARQAA